MKNLILFLLIAFTTASQAQNTGIGFNSNFPKAFIGTQVLIPVSNNVSVYADFNYGYSGNHHNAKFYDPMNYGDLLEVNNQDWRYRFSIDDHFTRHYVANAGLSYAVSQSFSLYALSGINFDDRFVIAHDPELMSEKYSDFFMVARKHDINVNYGGGVMFTEPGYFLQLGYDAKPEGFKLGIGVFL